MELTIKNKWISFGGSSIVQDLAGRDIMKVKGKVFSFTSKKYVQDLEGNTKYVVRNKFWRLFARKAFVEDTNKNILVRIRRKIFSLHDRYFVESSLGEMEIIGNIFQFNYRIILNGQEIGHIARRVSLRDSFVLTISDGFEPMLFVALVIAIDNITDRKDADNSAS